MQNYVQRPDHIHVVLADTVKGGDPVIVGDLIGVAESDGNGVDLVAVLTTGVVRLKKAAGELTQGAKVYYDADAKKVTSTAADNPGIGIVWKTAASGDEEVEVSLVGAVWADAGGGGD